MPYLEIVTAQQRQTLVLTGTPVTIGRANTNTIALNDQQASRAHCVVEKNVEGYCLRDLDSRNGTYHNGEQIESVVLANGDEIRIGMARITFNEGDPPA